MATHVKVIAAVFLFFGTLWTVIAVLGPAILAGLAGMVGTSGDPDAAVGATILGFAGVAVTLFCRHGRSGLPGHRWGLFKLKPWARIAGIIMAAICLTNFPVGTAFGIYALVILFKKELRRCSRAVSRPSVPEEPDRPSRAGAPADGCAPHEAERVEAGPFDRPPGPPVVG